MVVKIRLARFGRRKAPFYNIVVAQARFVPSPLPLESFADRKQEREE
jgi:small subunit ribosomal protein S16